MKGDLHVHTVFSDGKNTPEEMVLTAIEKGFSYIGFSDHAPMTFDDGCAMKADKLPEYAAEINRLKEKYKDQITIYLGLEMDSLSPLPSIPLDYRIGSVHYLEMADGHHVPIDWKIDMLKHGVDTYFGGDIYALIEAYYERVGQIVQLTGADIIGHFDLVTIFQEREHLFDETHPRYISAWQKAVDNILPHCKLFEINTGAVSRGYRTAPYPAPALQAYILEKGGRFIQNSDSHNKDTLGFCAE